jgi:hypothetical protein
MSGDECSGAGCIAAPRIPRGLRHCRAATVACTWPQSRPDIEIPVRTETDCSFVSSPESGSSLWTHSSQNSRREADLPDQAATMVVVVGVDVPQGPQPDLLYSASAADALTWGSYNCAALDTPMVASQAR